MGKITNKDEPNGARITIPGVELVKAGTWGGHPLTEEAKARSEKDGGIQVTAKMIADMAAAGSDSEIDEAPVKLGHFDARFDGEPAPGWVTNLRVSDDGETLLGDITDVPVGIYPLLKTGYKRRSVEMQFDKSTGSGEYSAVLTGLALLGVQAPAVNGLSEMADLYASSGTEGNTAHIPHNGAATSEDGTNALMGTNENEGNPTVDILEKLREKLGLPAEADEAAVLARIDELIAAQAEADEAAGDAGAPADAANSGAALSSAPGTVSVSSAVFSSMQADLAKLREESEKRNREEIISAALSEGKITTAEAPQWENALQQAPKETAALLSSLPSQKVNTAPAPEALNADDAQALAAQWETQNK